MSRLRHGHSFKGKWTPTYRSWVTMIQRCTNPASNRYASYGARGITVCKQWFLFDTFLKDMGQRPPGKQLERIDNHGNYDPDNCRWATRKEQSRNTNRNRRLLLNGVTKCIAEWAELYGLKPSTIRSRLADGWSNAAAITTPPRPMKPKFK